MLRRQFVVKYETPELMEYYYSLGVMDILWSSQLQLTPHKVVKFSNIAQTIQWSNNRGHLWVPPSLSDPRPDAGVLRSSHEAMKKHLPLLRNLKFNMILEFLDKHGRTDWSREKMNSNLPVTIPIRVRAGGNDHSYACLPGERAPWTFLRDPTRVTISDALLKYGGGQVRLEFGKLLDFIQNVLDDILPYKVCEDPFIYETFTRKFLEPFGCKTCRFPCFDSGVSDMCIPQENESNSDDKETDDHKSPGVRHRDIKNGQNARNDVSVTFSRFFQAKKISDVARTQLEKDQVEDIEDVIDDLLQFLLKGEEDIERLKRFFLILYTRRAHETFKLNERMAEGLKNKLRQFRSMIDKAYKPFSGSFLCPHKIDLSDSRPFQELVITQDKPELTVQASKVPANYCREVKCSSAITVACRSKERLADLGAPKTKLLEIILPILFMGSFAKLFFICEEFVSKLDVAAKDTNLTVLLLATIKDKFGKWSGGPDHRGHPISLDLIAIYSDDEVHAKALLAMKTFAHKMENNSKMTILEYKILLDDTVASIPGVGLFYGQNLGLYLALCGYITKNLHNSFLCFPVEGYGSSQAIEKENAAIAAEVEALAKEDSATVKGPLLDLMRDFGFKADPNGFKKTVRIISVFTGLESRPYWVECIFCDCIGPSSTSDWLFKGQSMFWIFKTENEFGETVFVAREKMANSLFYVDVVSK
jgi:hypothetical protein